MSQRAQPWDSDVVRRRLAETLSLRPVLAFDFDGTLAPIVAKPGDARIDPRVPPLLQRLRRTHVVAIVSGREIDDLRPRVGMDGIDLVGNHGNEWLIGSGPQAGRRMLPPSHAAQTCRAWHQVLEPGIAQLGAQLGGSEGVVTSAGIELEPKALSVSLHYRHAADPKEAARQLRRLVRTLEPAPEVIDGKFVMNLMPQGLVTKYEGIQRLVEQHVAGAALFVGDDVTDELAFERAPPQWLTVRVFDAEAGADTPTHAMASVHGIDGVVALLSDLVNASAAGSAQA